MSTADLHPLDQGAPAPNDVSASVLVVPALVGGALAVGLGVYGRLHGARPAALPTLGLASPLELKVVLASIAGALALVQLASALAMWGRWPGGGRDRPWLPAAHRWTGTVAFLFSLPVAYHCLWSLGFRDSEPRVLAHSLFGCAFYGAFAAKMLVLRRPTAPGWAIPVAGGLLLVLLVCLWSTSALWFLTTVGFA